MEKRRNSKFSEDLKLYVISNTIEFATIELTIRAASLVVSLDSEAVIVQSVWQCLVRSLDQVQKAVDLSRGSHSNKGHFATLLRNVHF